MCIRAIKTTTAALPMVTTSATAADAEYKSKTTVEQDGDDYKSKTETKSERNGREVEEERNVPAPPNTVIIERGISR